MTWSIQRQDPSRLHISVPVRLKGQDEGGKEFDREAWTLNVSAGGACIQIPPDLNVPKHIRVTCEDYQFRADADVVVVWERTRPQHMIGVRVLHTKAGESWRAR
jgi:hypothetical protein